MADVTIPQRGAAVQAYARVSAERMPNAPSVAVVVLNWNGRDDTIECIESLRTVDYPNFQVMVVDNGSTDDSVQAIRARFPQQEIVETGRNLGFAEGNNVGIRLALERNADYVFLLNNDTVVAPSLLSELIKCAESCPGGGVFAPTIYYHAEPQRRWFAGIRWNAERMEFRHIEEDPGYRIGGRSVVDTLYACGCAFLVKSAVLRRIGLLDPKFFLTFEETDFCYRARREGIGCYYVPSAELWHKISVSFGGAESPLVKYFITRNRLLWGERHLSRAELLRLYKVTWWDLSERLMPRSEAPLRPRGVVKRLRWMARRLATHWKDPENQAVAWGVLHYFLRRFGDAPGRIRLLARARPLR